MKPVLLSHDSEVLLCSVPDEVAEDLEAYCLRFACDWLWHSPEAKKYHLTLRGVDGVVYDSQDFLDYLNAHVFPDRPSFVIRGLGCWCDEIPDAYAGLPRFQF